MGNQTIKTRLAGLKDKILEQKFPILQDDEVTQDLNWFLDSGLCESLIPLYGELAKVSLKQAEDFEASLWKLAFRKVHPLEGLECFALGFTGDVSFPSRVSPNEIAQGLQITLLPRWQSPNGLLNIMPSGYRDFLNRHSALKPQMNKIFSQDLEDFVCLGKDAPTLVSRCLIGIGQEGIAFNLTDIADKIKDICGFKAFQLTAIGNPIDVAVECETQMDLYRVDVWMESQTHASIQIRQHKDDLVLTSHSVDGGVIAQMSINGAGLTPELLYRHLGYVKNLYLASS